MPELESESGRKLAGYRRLDTLRCGVLEFIGTDYFTWPFARPRHARACDAGEPEVRSGAVWIGVMGLREIRRLPEKLGVVSEVRVAVVAVRSGGVVNIGEV